MDNLNRVNRADKTNRIGRISRTLIALMLAFAMSFSAAFADSTQESYAKTDNAATKTTKQQASEAKIKPTTGVYKKNGHYYYKSPITKKIRKKAGFIKWKGDR